MAEDQVDGFEAGADAQLTDATAQEFTAPNNASQNQATEQRIVKRRNRRPVVCKPCRERRSKCSREKPCSICEKRGEAHLCVYAEPHDKVGRNAGTRTNKSVASRVKQLEQLSQLETLFKRYIAQDQPQDINRKDHYASNQQPTPASTINDTQQGNMDPATLPHWSSLFSQLRSSMEGYEDALSDMDDGPIVSDEKPVLLGATNPPLLSTVIRQYLPHEKDEIDRRLSEYFGATYIVIPVIHAPTFLGEYEEFEQTSSDMLDPIWTALLFAILSISALITGAQGNEDDLSKHDDWVNATSQCLEIGGYTKPRAHLIPALLLLAQSQYMRYLDPSREVALIVSLVTRLAFQSGFNREPGPLVSPFEAEMRRRYWVMIRHLDRQVASQFGVPASVQSNAADIEPPHNLLDDDFNASTTQLPPSRPATDHSVINTFIMKNKLMSVFDEIYSFAIDTRASVNEDSEVARLESLLHSEHASIPEVFKLKPISMSINDPPYLRMTRITLEQLYQKALIILHRRRMARQVSTSYSACTMAARNIVNTFAELTDALRPGKLMEGKGWMISATIVNDFLLACMTLSMAVLTPQSTSKSPTEESLDVLETARNLCLNLTGRSRGALRVLNAISIVLTRSGRDTALPLDPRMQQSPPLQQSGYQPAPPYSMNGYTPAATTMPPPAHSGAQVSPFQTFASPAPSSALSQERSTSNGPQGQLSNTAQYATPLSGFWPGMPPSYFGEGQPIMAGVFPSSNQQQQVGQSQQMVPPFNFNQPLAPQQQMQGGLMTPAGDSFERLTATMGVGEIDWSVFDQYITEWN